LFWPYLILSLLFGGLMGLLFFGGLWWTVQRLVESNRPYLLSVASFMVRTAVVMAAFYLLLAAGWPHLLAALIGFWVARTILARKLTPALRA